MQITFTIIFTVISVDVLPAYLGRYLLFAGLRLHVLAIPGISHVLTCQSGFGLENICMPIYSFKLAHFSLVDLYGVKVSDIFENIKRFQSVNYYVVIMRW